VLPEKPETESSGIRQIRYERRLSNRQGRWEREVAREFQRFDDAHLRADTRLRKEIRSVLTGWQKEIEKAMVRR
jgi:hypothetical protein